MNWLTSGSSRMLPAVAPLSRALCRREILKSMKLFLIFIVCCLCCTSKLAISNEVKSEKIRFVQYFLSKDTSNHRKLEYSECYSEAMFDVLTAEEIKFLVYFLDIDRQNPNKSDAEIEQIAVSTYKFKSTYKDSIDKKWVLLEGDRTEKCKHLK